MATTLLYLHGVGDQVDVRPWREGLNVGLQVCGYGTTREIAVIEPDYRQLLKSTQLPARKAPDPTVLAPTTYHSRRAEYEIAQASLRRLLELDEVAFRNALPDPGPAALVAMSLGVLAQAKKYLRDERLRATIAHHVLEHLPKSVTEVVVVGHSLGSLVAIDLLRYLPARVTVRRLITIGSPAGHSAVHRDSDRLVVDFPFGKVQSWLNVVSGMDLVTAGRGIAPLMPAAQDLAIWFPKPTHAAYYYLADKQVARAIGEATFGSRSTELAGLETSLDIPFTEVEAFAVFALAYAHRVATKLKEDEPKDARRYSAALAITQATVAGQLAFLARRENRPVNSVVTELENGKRPLIPKVWTSEQAVQLMTVAASTNLIAPYVVDDDDVQVEILESIATGLGYPRNYGTQVELALEEAKDALGSPTWAYLLMGAAGLAILAAGPVGLAMAGPAGVAGAAAITSALAAFGPGGMIGGMALAGTLLSTGAATTATSIALASSSAAVVELEVLRRMTHALARQKLKMPGLLDDWEFISTLESHVANELHAHEDISEDDAPIVKELERKSRKLRKAIAWMIKNDLGPPGLE